MDQSIQAVTWKGYDTGRYAYFNLYCSVIVLIGWIDSTVLTRIFFGWISILTFFLFLSQDSTFEFERKRNRPERYDRNLSENTLKAIKKIDKIRGTREVEHITRRYHFWCCFFLVVEKHNMFFEYHLKCKWGYENLCRMKGKKEKERREAKKELEQNISLVKAPVALREDPSLTLPIKVKVSQTEAAANLMEE